MSGKDLRYTVIEVSATPVALKTVFSMNSTTFHLFYNNIAVEGHKIIWLFVCD